MVGTDCRVHPRTVYDIKDEPVPYVVDGRVPAVTEPGPVQKLTGWCGETIPWGCAGPKVLNATHRAVLEVRMIASTRACCLLLLP